MSTKNQLQEICQSYGYNLPTYHTCYSGGDAHQPIYKCQLTVPPSVGN